MAVDHLGNINPSRDSSRADGVPAGVDRVFLYADTTPVPVHVYGKNIDVYMDKGVLVVRQLPDRDFTKGIEKVDDATPMYDARDVMDAGRVHVGGMPGNPPVDSSARTVLNGWNDSRDRGSGVGGGPSAYSTSKDAVLGMKVDGAEKLFGGGHNSSIVGYPADTFVQLEKLRADTDADRKYMMYLADQVDKLIGAIEKMDSKSLSSYLERLKTRVDVLDAELDLVKTKVGSTSADRSRDGHYEYDHAAGLSYWKSDSTGPTGFSGSKDEEPTCGACRRRLTLVRPGKHQCDNPHCTQNGYSTLSGSSGVTGVSGFTGVSGRSFGGYIGREYTIDFAKSMEWIVDGICDCKDPVLHRMCSPEIPYCEVCKMRMLTKAPRTIPEVPKWFKVDYTKIALSLEKAEAARWLFEQSIRHGTAMEFGMQEILEWLDKGGIKVDEDHGENTVD